MSVNSDVSKDIPLECFFMIEDEAKELGHYAIMGTYTGASESNIPMKLLCVYAC